MKQGLFDINLSARMLRNKVFRYTCIFVRYTKCSYNKSSRYGNYYSRFNLRCKRGESDWHDRYRSPPLSLANRLFRSFFSLFISKVYFRVISRAPRDVAPRVHKSYQPHKCRARIVSHFTDKDPTTRTLP